MFFKLLNKNVGDKFLGKVLVEDSKKNGRPDGESHFDGSVWAGLAIGGLAGMLAMTLVPLLLISWAIPILLLGLVGTWLTWFLIEVSQEKGMCKKRKCYPWNWKKWSPNRHQDVKLGVAGYVVGVIPAFPVGLGLAFFGVI